MKQLLTLGLILFSLLATAQTKSRPKTEKKTDSTVAVSGGVPVDTGTVTIRLTLPQASTLIYTLRYSTVMNASEANQFADYLVKQVNAQMSKPKEEPKPKH